MSRSYVIVVLDNVHLGFEFVALGFKEVFGDLSRNLEFDSCIGLYFRAL